MKDILIAFLLVFIIFTATSIHLKNKNKVELNLQEINKRCTWPFTLHQVTATPKKIIIICQHNNQKITKVVTRPSNLNKLIIDNKELK